MARLGGRASVAATADVDHDGVVDDAQAEVLAARPGPPGATANWWSWPSSPRRRPGTPAGPVFRSSGRWVY